MALNPASTMRRNLQVRYLGLSDYGSVWQRMKQFTDDRSADTPDELWFLEHEPVFTLGQAGKTEHLLAPGNIPVIKTDRGGQVTYHGPGQLVGYLLFDLRSLNINIRDLVTGIEQSIVDLLTDYGITSEVVKKAPGVYVRGKKIAALGLRVRRGCSFHGLSLNVDMDCEPFSRINPCGYEGLEVVQLRELDITDDIEQVAEKLLARIKRRFGYDE